MTRILALALVPAVLAGCRPGTDEAPAGQAEPALEYGTTADRDIPAHDPDTIPFIQEGRTLHFGGRDWMVVGGTVQDPILRHVGEAEGLPLYATPAERLATTLFFHRGGGHWQPLQPVPTPLDIRDDTMAVQPDTERVPPPRR
jgi:hypothetical protein